ncbi:MAG: PBP1A family penicillin-binding protein [Alphaproteobacteria bacterium]|nr:PBP1A family penicillin-binding protein [Alphaproteobacteria bacterium]
MKIFRNKSEDDAEVETDLQVEAKAEIEADALGRIEPTLGPISSSPTKPTQSANPAPDAALIAATVHAVNAAAGNCQCAACIEARDAKTSAASATSQAATTTPTATAASRVRSKTSAPAADAPPNNVPPADAGQPKQKNKSRRTSALARLITTAAILVFGWLAAMMIYYTLKYPDPLSIHADKAPTIRILARDGSLLAERGRKHPFIPFDLIPTHVVEAVVSIEDRRFYDHGGVDFSGMVRAAFANLRAGRYAQGGSTITQQLAKNLYLSPERTLLRKLDELSIAIWLELRLSKQEIIELYLNQVYFGGGAYGIEAAAQRHFGKSARALSLAEGAVIAGLLKAPSRYSPSSSPAAARARGRVVLRAMHAAKYISSAQLKKALRQPVRFSKAKPKNLARQTAYATDYILDHMPALLAGETGQIVVETSIDLQLQRFAQKKLSEKLRQKGKKLKAGQGALVVLDRTGGIRALVGGADYAKSQYNRATKSLRQPGSTFKPFVYLTALESGMKPETITYDLPLSISGWAPKNSNGQFRGKVTLREALAKSINTVAVRLGLDFGPSNVAALANRVGIKAKLRSDPSLALGTSEVTLLELTGAYALFSNGGRRVQPHIIRRIPTVSGRILFAHDEAADDTVVALRHVGAMNDMLNAALIVGTGRKAALKKHPAAGKTGTSQGFRDAWFVGYTAHLTAGIWLGNDKGKPMNRVVGGSLPADIWREVMHKAHANLAPMPLAGTFRPGTRIGDGRKPFIARFEGGARKRGRRSKAALTRKRTVQNSQRIRITPPKNTEAKRKRAARSKTPARNNSTAINKIAKIKKAAAKSKTTAVANAKPVAPLKPPPLPQQQRRSPKPTPPIHPTESISPDFIARALNEVPTGPTPRSDRTYAGNSNGFDLDAIRKRLDQAPANTVRRPPYMALGRGAITSRPTTGRPGQ